MADKKISALTAATTPLAGTEVLPIVQSGSTVKVSVTNLTSYAPAFSAFASGSAQTLSPVTDTKIELPSETFDTNNNFDNVTNYRFTPTVAGYYQINAAVTVTSASALSGIAPAIKKNGTGVASGSAVGNAGVYPTAFVASVIYFNGSTDYVELFVYNGSAGNVTTSLGQSQTYMNGSLVRGA
jgi:hypothetical protein